MRDKDKIIENLQEKVISLTADLIIEKEKSENLQKDVDILKQSREHYVKQKTLNNAIDIRSESMQSITSHSQSESDVTDILNDRENFLSSVIKNLKVKMNESFEHIGKFEFLIIRN